MPDGRISLAFKGPEDLYLNVDPQISFFRCVYRRHSKFTVQTKKEIFSNEGFGRMSVCRLAPDSGDLIKNISLQVGIDPLIYRDPPTTSTDSDGDDSLDCTCVSCLQSYYSNGLCFGWVNSLGHALIESYSIKFNGRQIDKQYGEWLEIWSELAQPLDKRLLYNEMIGRVEANTFSVNTFPLDQKINLIIPLSFWFCRFTNLALPITSMSRTDIDITVNFREFNSLWVCNQADKYPKNIPTMNSYLLIDYIYLDNNERLMFSQTKQLYLIDQINKTETSVQYGSKMAIIDMFFNRPVKELIWVIQRNDVIANPIQFNPPVTTEGYPLGNDWFNFTPELSRKRVRTCESFDKGVLNFNGIDLFDKLDSNYFRLYQPYNCHTRGPTNNIYVHSFSIKPEDLPPTGTINFSSIDTKRLVLHLNKKGIKYHNDDISTPSTLLIKLYAVCNNVLAVENGIADVLFQ